MWLLKIFLAASIRFSPNIDSKQIPVVWMMTPIVGLKKEQAREIVLEEMGLIPAGNVLTPLHLFSC